MEDMNVNNNFTSVSGETGFFQIISKIKDCFIRTTNSESKSEVKIKVTKIEGDASDIVMRLINVKSILKAKLDDKTYGYVVELIDPIAQDARKMSGLVQKANQDQQLENVLERYQKWMSKAKSLVRLEKHSGRSEHVVQVIVEHLLGNMNEVIDRDIRSLRNYRSQIAVSFLENNNENDLHEIDNSLEYCICALRALKETKINPGLEQFDTWKRWVNSRRAALFDIALHSMDLFKDNKG